MKSKIRGGRRSGRPSSRTQLDAHLAYDDGCLRRQRRRRGEREGSRAISSFSATAFVFPRSGDSYGPFRVGVAQISRKTTKCADPFQSRAKHSGGWGAAPRLAVRRVAASACDCGLGGEEARGARGGWRAGSGGGTRTGSSTGGRRRCCGTWWSPTARRDPSRRSSAPTSPPSTPASSAPPSPSSSTRRSTGRITLARPCPSCRPSSTGDRGG